jgi:hypothetical protein
VVWLGDLNYRLTCSDEEGRKCVRRGGVWGGGRLRVAVQGWLEKLLNNRQGSACPELLLVLACSPPPPPFTHRLLRAGRLEALQAYDQLSCEMRAGRVFQVITCVHATPGGGAGCVVVGGTWGCQSQHHQATHKQRYPAIRCCCCCCC